MQRSVSERELDDGPEKPRAGFVRFQQGLARQALVRGSLGAARLALRVLRPRDFAGGEPVCGRYLDTLRNFRAAEQEIVDAVRALIDMSPACDE